mgnify:CR=1 FL=1
MLLLFNGQHWLRHRDLHDRLEYAADGLGFSLEYDCSQFSHGTVQRMARHWQNLLLAMARGPEQRLGELDMLGTPEQQATFAQWNPAPAEHPADQALHSRIEAQVQRTPDAIAVTCEGQALSYAQLNQRANALALPDHRGIERRIVAEGPGCVAQTGRHACDRERRNRTGVWGPERRAGHGAGRHAGAE